MVRKILAAALLVTMIGLAGTANAQTAVNVSAVLGAACISISDGSFFFAVADPSVNTPASSVVSPVVQCTNGAVATLTAESANAPSAPVDCSVGAGFQGLLNEAAPGTGQFAYVFSCGTGSITGTGIEPANRTFDVSVTVNGNVGAGEANVAPPGTYSDTITLTLSL